MKEVIHLSKSNKPILLTPRIPDNFFTKNGYEDNKIPRVCFSETIDGALMAISRPIEGEEFYVHTPEKPISLYSNKSNSFVNNYVPDAKLTKEVWITEPVNTRIIGKVRVGRAIDKYLTFSYGDNVARLYRWNYDFIKI